MTTTPWGNARTARCTGLVLLFLAAAGCEPGTGALSGTVTFKDKPLPGGMLTVAAPDGRVGTSKIGEDGAYAIADAPAGTLRLTIITQPPVAGMDFPRGGAKP